MRQHIGIIAVYLVVLMFAGCTASKNGISSEVGTTMSQEQDVALMEAADSSTTINRNTVPNTEVTDIIEHQHSFSKGDVVGPTCKEGGYTWYICACGKKEKREPTESNPHVWGRWQEIRSPTCTAEGIKSRACTVCGVQQSTTIDRSAHNYTLIQTIAPTQYAEGYDLYRCAVCQATDKRNTIPQLKTNLSIKEAEKAADAFIQSAEFTLDHSLEPDNSSFCPPAIWEADQIPDQYHLNQNATAAVIAVMERLKDEKTLDELSQCKMRCYIKYIQEENAYWIYVLWTKP